MRLLLAQSRPQVAMTMAQPKPFFFNVNQPRYFSSADTEASHDDFKGQSKVKASSQDEYDELISKVRSLPNLR